MNKRRTGAIVSYLYSATQVLVNLLYVPLLLSGIGQSEYGLYQMVGSAIAYISIINTTFSAGATRFYCKYYALGDEDGMANTLGILKRVYRIAYCAVFFAAVALMIVLGFVYRDSFSVWEIQESCIMLGVLALNLVLTMSNTMSIACITAHEEFAFLKLSQLVVILIQPVLILVLIQLYPYAYMVTIAQLICNFALRVVQQIFARKKLGMDDRLRFLDKKMEREILAFSGALLFGVIADQIFWKTDQLILGYLYGTAAVAVYSVGSQVVNAYMPLGTAISSVFMPKVSEIWHKEHNLSSISNLFIKVSRIALYPLLAVLLGFIVLGQDFIRLWAGEEYGLAWWVTVIELVPFTIDIAQNIGLTILQVMNRYGFRAKMYFVAALVNVVLTIVFANAVGIVGAAVASACAMLASSGLMLNWYYQTRVGLDMGAWWRSVLQEIWPMIALCVIGWFAWKPFIGCGWGCLVAGIVVWAILFALVSYFFCFNQYEKALLTSLTKKLLRK